MERWLGEEAGKEDIGYDGWRAVSRDVRRGTRLDLVQRDAATIWLVDAA